MLRSFDSMGRPKTSLDGDCVHAWGFVGQNFWYKIWGCVHCTDRWKTQRRWGERV